MATPSKLISKYQLPVDTATFGVSAAFVVEAEVGRLFVSAPEVTEELTELYASADSKDPNSLMIKSFAVSKLLRKRPLPNAVKQEMDRQLQAMKADEESLFTIRPLQANPLDSPLRVKGSEGVEAALSKHYADHFTNGLIHLSEDPTYDPFQRLTSLVVQRSGLSEASGLALSYDPKSKAENFVVVLSTWGQAEDILRRTVGRDEMWFHKHTLEQGFTEPVFERVGEKQFQLFYDPCSHRLEHRPLTRDKARSCSLPPKLAQEIASKTFEWSLELKAPIEVSWSRNGEGIRILSVRALPALQKPTLKFYRRLEDGPCLLKGRAASHSLAQGRVRVVESRHDLDDFQNGEILVAKKTEPDWEPGFRRAAAIITSFDRRVSHATILAREMGIPAVLEAPNCDSVLQTGQNVTVSCCEGETATIFDGEVNHAVEEFSLEKMPSLETKLMVNLSMPERAVATAQFPWAGAGLVRSEFMIGGWVKIHPNALIFPDRLSPEIRRTVERLCGNSQPGPSYFVDKMSQAVGLLAASFWPRPVTVRLSDFKSNEYARLVGGEAFEPKEKNSMMGWRGASRYLHEDYREAFLLELEVLKRVRDRGFSNLRILIPFCRTPEEGEEVLSLLQDAGLRTGSQRIEVWCMAELPSNVFLATEFAQLFDGISIGSSDLTSLSLGVARDAEKVSSYFDELHPAMIGAYERIIEACHGEGKPVSFCGQVASEDPEFAAFLTEMGIDILSLAPDALRPTLLRLTTSR